MSRFFLVFLQPLLLLAALFAACKPEDEKQAAEPHPDTTQAFVPPAHFPPLRLPDDNPPTDARVALGKKLFFDPILSRDYTLSCASCHRPEHAFSDPVAISNGTRGQKTTRNSMMLANVAWAPPLFWDGASPTLELQALAPIENPVEMDMTVDEVVARLKASEAYRALFQNAFGREPDAYGLTRALASYERTLVSADSPFDRYITKRDTNAMSPAAKRGWALFNSETAECFHCHAGPLQTDFTFQNNGLYAEYADNGRGALHDRKFEYGMFKVPSLRNVAVTAPYMHDGSKKTLEEVLEHYMSGGAVHRNKSPFLRPFKLTDQEKQDMLAFLHALTDTAFINNLAHRP